MLTEKDCTDYDYENGEYFQCNDGECQPAEWECDDYTDCAGGEDELNCGECMGRTQYIW